MIDLTCSRVRDMAPGFVLGALERAEMAAVRDHLRTCTRPHPEIREFGGTVSYIGASVAPIEPATGLKASVLAAVEADSRARRAAPSTERAPLLSVVGSVRESGTGRAARLRSRRVAALVSLAAALVVVAVGAAAIVPGLLQPQDDRDIWGYIGEAGQHSTVLAPVDGGKGAGAAALLPSRNLRVYVRGLAATHDDEVYVVWVSIDGGSARSAGWFTVDGSGTGEVLMSDVNPASTIAIYVCREANRDVARPTGPVALSGTISMWAVPVSTPTR